MLAAAFGEYEDAAVYYELQQPGLGGWDNRASTGAHFAQRSSGVSTVRFPTTGSRTGGWVNL